MAEVRRVRSGRPSVLALNIRDKSALYAAYLSRVKGGGLFVPTSREYRLGDEVYLLLSLLDEPDKVPVTGNVVWITPAGAQGGRTQGIGVQFSADEGGLAARNRIEALLGGMLNSGNPTHTF